MARQASKAKETAEEKAKRELKERIAHLASKIDGVTAKNMFGDPYFFLQGHGVVGLMGTKALFYLDVEASEQFLALPATRRWMQESRDPAAGWHVLKEAAAQSDSTLDAWLRRAVSYVTTLPPKVGKKPAKRR